MRAFMLSVLVTVVACTQGSSDKDIERELDATLRAAAPGVVMTVKKGVVTLSGTCPDESCKHTSENAAKATEGVKEVVNNIIISTPP
jgi:hyperosmotically inducible periplasmic protein